MRINKFIIGIFTCLLCACVTSCNNSEKANNSVIAPGTYSTDIILYAEAENVTESRGFDLNSTRPSYDFNTSYTFDKIYLHKINANGDGVETSINIPLGEDCTTDSSGNKCFNIEVTKNDDNTYQVKVGGQTINLSSSEQVYFSNLSTATWTAETDNNQAPPEIASATILKQPTTDEGILNNELLKSKPYDGEGLITLIKDDQVIELTRHVTAYKFYVLFTDSKNATDQDQSISEEAFKTALGISNISDIEIKVYFGPKFASSYNLLTETATASGDVYYASNNQVYQSLEEFTAHSGGGDYSYRYTGYGYRTSKALITPVNSANTNPWYLYICIKYQGKEYYWAEQLTESVPGEQNRSNKNILLYDVSELAKITNPNANNTETSTISYVSRASQSQMERIDIKPIKVIVE